MRHNWSLSSDVCIVCGLTGLELKMSGLRVHQTECGGKPRSIQSGVAMGYGPGHGGAQHVFTPGNPNACNNCGAHAFDVLNPGTCIPVKLNPPFIPLIPKSGTEGAYAEPRVGICTCSIVSLMQQGCSCGGS